MPEPETVARNRTEAADQRHMVSMAARRAIADLEPEAVAAYEEVGELHTAAWEEQTLLQRIIRHRRDLEFLEGHPIQARFARSVHERVRAFGAAMRSTGLDCEWNSIASLGVVCRLETETAERAVRLRGLLMDAEARWEALHDRLTETRALADL